MPPKSTLTDMVEDLLDADAEGMPKENVFLDLHLDLCKVNKLSCPYVASCVIS